MYKCHEQNRAFQQHDRASAQNTTLSKFGVAYRPSKSTVKCRQETKAYEARNYIEIKI